MIDTMIMGPSRGVIVRMIRKPFLDKLGAINLVTSYIVSLSSKSPTASAQSDT